MKPADSTTSTKPEIFRQEQCESCGAQFECGAAAQNCWCAKIELTDYMRRDLQTKFSRCLCRSCLKNFETKKVSGALAQTAKQK